MTSLWIPLLVGAALASCSKPAAPTAPAPSAVDCPVAIMGHKHDAAGNCSEPPTAVGCMAVDQACDDAITYALDPDGDGWWFSDTCIPDGWTAAPYPDGHSDVPPAC